MTPRGGKLENCSTCLTYDAQHVCSSIHVARGFCCHDLKSHPRCSRILLLRTLTRIPLLHTIMLQRNLMRNQQLTTQSDDPFQFDDPPVPTPVIPSQSKPVYDHRDDLPHHIRTQLQSRIRKPAQNLEPDAKRLRLDAGKRAVLMLSHDVSSGPECCKPVTAFKSCENSGCADVLLTRRAANKEVAVRRTREIAAGTCGRCDGSRMGQVERVRVTKFLSKKQLNDIMKRNPGPENRGNQMGLHGKGPSRASRTTRLDLSFKGVKRDKGYIRTDAPAGSRDAFFMTLSAASQSGWDDSVFDCPVSVPLVRRHQETVAVADASQKIRLLGRSQGKCLLLLVRSAGREMLNVRGTSTARKCLRQLVLWSQSWNKVSTTCMDHLDLKALVHTHVDDFLSAFKKASKKHKDALQHLVHKLHLKQQSGLVVYCGRTICRDGNHIKVTQTRSTMSLECMSIDLAGANSGKPAHER